MQNGTKENDADDVNKDYDADGSKNVTKYHLVFVVHSQAQTIPIHKIKQKDFSRMITNCL